MSVMSSSLPKSSAKRLDVRTIVCTGMLCAIAYVVMFISKTIFAPIPVAGFLTFDLKDVIIAIGGFLYGPLNALCISVITSLIEMVTVSETGPIGLLMNVLSTIAFVCPAAFIYKRRQTLSAAVAGLVTGGILMTGIMLLWNYLITPLYMNVPRDVVVAMLPTAFLPFNLVKALMNGALTMLLYKPVVTALRKARLAPEHESTAQVQKRRTIGVSIVAVILLATAVLLGLVLAGVI
ncbi:ECF transporter S component [Pseudoflavonifractor sp.]|jgi:riboflavin transporter FmnP|uniref:ECF transporter S component n=1 Tax=Pseudoflavonifractor sp. TaxID=1980281 RepID=UPI003D8C966B